MYRLVPSTPSTGATGSGSWPTPAKADGERGSETYCRGNPTLLGAVRSWPTPDKGMADGGRALPEGTSVTGITPDGKKRQVGLTNAVKAWPTPRHEGFDAGGHRGTTDSLHSAVKADARHWPTPRAQMGALNQPSADKPHDTGGNAKRLEVEVGREIADKTGLKLSAAWTLALMAFPPDWCDDLPPDPLGATPT